MDDRNNAEHQRSHDSEVPTTDFASSRASWRAGLGGDEALRQQAVDLQQRADDHHYTYTWEWLGVPIIRLPDDVVVLQEIFWAYRPQRVVETGVARGGSMLLDASLIGSATRNPPCWASTCRSSPTRATRSMASDGARRRAARGRLDLRDAEDAARAFLAGAERAVLILDSNHTHDHVLAELRLLAPLLPVGGLVLVADTLVEEFPAGYYEIRPWDKGNNPATAVQAFLDERLTSTWTRTGPAGARHRVP